MLPWSLGETRDAKESVETREIRDAKKSGKEREQWDTKE